MIDFHFMAFLFKKTEILKVAQNVVQAAARYVSINWHNFANFDLKLRQTNSGRCLNEVQLYHKCLLMIKL